MIRYKVVIKGGFSCMVGHEIGWDSSEIDDRNPYRLFYKDNEIIEAPIDTLGIMVFDTLENADKFVKEHIIVNFYFPEIKEVDTLDKEIIPKTISYSLHVKELDKFYKLHRLVNSVAPIKGTICCHRIKVLKTIRIYYS